MKELDEILEEYGGNCAEWVEDGRVNGKPTSKEKIKKEARTAIISLMKSKQMSVEEIRKMIVGSAFNLECAYSSRRNSSIGRDKLLNKLATAIHKEQGKKLGENK